MSSLSGITKSGPLIVLPKATCSSLWSEMLALADDGIVGADHQAPVATNLSDALRNRKKEVNDDNPGSGFKDVRSHLS